MVIVPPPDAFSLSEGAVFHDHYEVVRRIDSGAMGTVYEVVDRRTKRRRALKIMLARFADNPEVTERFRREATITADVVSEHVVETYDAGVDASSGLPFLVMELLRGEDLGKIVARGPLLQTDVVTLLMQAASALDRMHAAGIIHRDLKPENLFVTHRDDGAPRLKVLDFGIAKVIEKSAPSATTTRNMGTPVYMSPEQVTGAGSVNHTADLYAVGHLAYTMLTGEPYWLEDALAHETVYPLLLRIMEGTVEPASVRALRTRKITLPPAFDAWFAKATAHAPEERFKSAAESIVALAVALEVPRPALPSYFHDAALSTATTESPPDAEQPILLLPAPARLPKSSEPEPKPSALEASETASAATEPVARAPKQEEALRTLSPVSTLPETSPAPSVQAPAPKSRRGPVIAIGIAFFAAGVVGAVLIARPRPSGSGLAPQPSSVALAATAQPSSTAEALPPTSAPEPTAAPTPSTTSAPASTETPSTNATTTPTNARPAKPPKRAPVATPSTKPTSSPQRPYVDPRRDL